MWESEVGLAIPQRVVSNTGAFRRGGRAGIMMSKNWRNSQFMKEFLEESVGSGSGKTVFSKVSQITGIIFQIKLESK